MLLKLQLEATLAAAAVSPKFRVKQVEEWMHARGVDSFEAMTNLPKELRADLARDPRVQAAYLGGDVAV